MTCTVCPGLRSMVGTQARPLRCLSGEGHHCSDVSLKGGTQPGSSWPDVQSWLSVSRHYYLVSHSSCHGVTLICVMIHVPFRIHVASSFDVTLYFMLDLTRQPQLAMVAGPPGGGCIMPHTAAIAVHGCDLQLRCRLAYLWLSSLCQPVAVLLYLT
jgi:hypothetical protein